MMYTTLKAAAIKETSEIKKKSGLNEIRTLERAGAAGVLYKLNYHAN